ncbi:MAG: hypothetical protein M5R36_07800 [Deltaproteobacteria bacterium]|nr:hypothetical protein [Deltaproteobacteria bacterium]
MVRRQRFFAIFAAAVIGASACSRELPARATPSPTPTPTEATPAMPLPGTVTNDQPPQPAETPAKPAEPAASPFSVMVRNCYLVDPEINPVGAPESREKGIRMVLTGSIRNSSDRIIYRAGAYSKLVVYFGKNARFEKHSGGLGIVPPITSSSPWRPGAWRDFKIVGRAFDPIYREFEPQALSGVLSLEARDPLDFRFAEEIARMKPRWDTLFGVVVDQTVSLKEDVTLRYGPHNAKSDLKSGDEVRLVAQQGGGYLAERENRLLGWLPADALAIKNYENLYPDNPARTFPMVATVEDRFEITISDYRYEPHPDNLPEAEGGYMVFQVKVKSLAERQALPCVQAISGWTRAAGGSRRRRTK